MPDSDRVDRQLTSADGSELRCERCGATDAANQCPRGMHHQFAPALRPVLSLCDFTGVMVQPWLDAGHPCTIVDIQHPEGKRTDSLLTRVGADITEWDGWADSEWAAVFAFPPCTHLAKSGARWWKDKGLTALIEALQVVDACRQIGESSSAPYLIENPSGALSTHWRKPDYAFDPADFGGYDGGENDNYTKLTNLWVGNGFVMPERRPIPATDGSRMHRVSPGPERANIRSQTPRGFAQAVFEANRYGLTILDQAVSS